MTDPGSRKRFLLCLLSACLVWFSFPNFLEKTLSPSFAFLGWIALVPFFLALEGLGPAAGARWGFLFGFLQFGGILYWIAFLEEAQYLSGLAWFALVSYLAVYPLLFGFLYRALCERWGKPLFGAAPFLWVALEYLRGSRPWGGFNWGELGYSQAPYPWVLVFTTFAGVYGLTFAMVWFNASLASWWTSLGPGKEGRRFPWGLLLLPAAILLQGWVTIGTAHLERKGKVALLQPSIDQSVKWDKENERATYRVLGDLAERAALSKPDLILWPETAAPAFLLASPPAKERVLSIVRRTGTSNLVGCMDMEMGKDGKEHYYNGAVHFDGNGTPAGAYHKRHLVPFGEFVPFQRYLSFLGPVVGDLGNCDPGREYREFQAGGFSYTPMICYEVIFPGDVQRALAGGADALVNISNDAWYGRTASAYQHVLMAVVRAAEEHKPLLRSANTGISLATDPFGRILASTGLFDRTEIEAEVTALEAPPTLYSRWGNWFPLMCCGLSFLWLGTVLLRGVRKREEAP